MAEDEFASIFKKLTGNEPFPWQWDLYDRWFSKGKFPRSCDIPTGLGKTSIIAIWLIALANHRGTTPRRLVYVVNRRTVVDQTTDEVKKLRENVHEAGLFDALRDLCALSLDSDQSPLALSTLRGQFADNREWSADPARPAVISGTVDMIGSRLLFGGYGVGFKSKPLHAGFLGQDALLIHDEAHLEPAFQELITTIEAEQKRCNDSLKLKVIELTATSRVSSASSNGGAFELTRREKNPPIRIPKKSNEPLHTLWRRLNAPKTIGLVSVDDEQKKLADKIAELALDSSLRESQRAILVFARTVKDVETIVAKLRKEKQDVQQLTGTLRGFERDQLPYDRIFKRFLSNAIPDSRTVYLVCTSAGEVGVNISGDHLVCDLTTFESMAQRFGRVNRFGDRDDTRIHVVCPAEFNETHEFDQRRKKTLQLLRQLDGDGSPAAISRLDGESRKAAFAPEPRILPATDILFDSWSLTTIREKLPGRPAVERYVRGISDDDREPPETRVVWREEVGILSKQLRQSEKAEKLIEDLLEDYPIKPHEILRDQSRRVFGHLQLIADRHPDADAWLLGDDGTAEVLTLKELSDRDAKERINWRTVLLPPIVGGLSEGLLNGNCETANDVADEWRDETGKQRRSRVWDDDPRIDEKIERMRLIRVIDTDPDTDEKSEHQIHGRRYWYWYVRPKSADDDGSKTSLEPVLWDDHTIQVASNADTIASALNLSEELRRAIGVAARFHDLGKKRVLWQRSIGNPNPRNWLAKSGKGMRPIESTDYRHEFGSLVDIYGLTEVVNDAEFQRLSEPMKDFVLHLIASHHGRARPHFPAEEIVDEDPKGQDISAIAAEIPRRFVRLQRDYGRWGLAYLESILRAADYAASAAAPPTGSAESRRPKVGGLAP